MGGLRGVRLRCVGGKGGRGGLCYARNNLKKSQFYVILRGVLWGPWGTWGSVGGAGGRGGFA